MAIAARTRAHQNTTIRLPRAVYERARMAVPQSQASSFNEFVVQAIEEKVQRLTEAEIDQAFAQMANDPDYQRAAVQLANEFETSDWEAFTSAGKDDHERPKARPIKTRSR